MNVLQLINYPGKGGSENYILTLADRLRDRDCKFYLGYSMEGPLIDRARAFGIPALNVPMNSPYDLRAANILKDLCKEFCIDIIHTHFFRENHIAVISKLFGNKAAIINTCHLLTRGNIFYRTSNSIAAVLNDSLIAVSNAVKEKMTDDGVDKRLIRVIYNGVNTEYWKEKRNYRIRSELGLDRNDFVITSTARFTEEKGHMFLLEVIKELKRMSVQLKRRNGGNIRFVLAGDGEMLDECKDFSKMLGIHDEIVFTGYLEDVKPLLNTSDLFISHSKSEAFSISILEALACGLPVMATDAGGTREVINESNSCGLLVEYGDVGGFADGIERFLTDRAFFLECKDNALKTVQEKFNLDKTAEDTYNLYIEARDVHTDISGADR